MTAAAIIPHGRIGFYYLCASKIIMIHTQPTLEGHDNGLLIIPRLNPYEEIRVSAEVGGGLFEAYISPSHTPDGSIVYRRSSRSFVVFHNEPFTDGIFNQLCQLFEISPEVLDHEGIDGHPW